MEKLRRVDELPAGFATWGMASSSVISSRTARIPEDAPEASPSLLEEVRQLTRMLSEVRHLALLTSGRVEEELPEIFDLRPVSSRKVIFQIVKRAPASFELAWEPDETREEE